MAGQADEFLQGWQALARDSWDAWLRGLQPPAPAGGAADEPLPHMASLKPYLDWLQGMAAGTTHAAPAWPAQGGPFPHASFPGGPAFAVPPPGADPGAAWLAWWQQALAQPAGAAPVAAFGYTREQQLQQQALAAAMAECRETGARYQALLQRAGSQGVARLQAKLADMAAAGQAVDSLKALYDLWVDAAEDAYAEIALTDEFREAYGAMSNAQMKLRRLQRQLVEQCSRELGVPTRGEVDSLGQRLQQVRRELRTVRGDAGTGALAAVRAELDALARRLDALEGRRDMAVKTASRPVAKRAKAPPAARRAAPPAKRPAPRGRK
ncbi:poly(R)-hydroxyalkanoic acid synthase subunit PhaE [Fulvimonas sp. R45]|uniref:poly(R)-hydroxyalkanoic acid synthase subunit PhaE n=1 Tax=Fulvimonas sp. R45 TaxID=3045937 RepID=UPI00265EC660|nr:poly(R)-hydroxyalkanoic acid synthase subunit PhaE [Fulvimonas sp. R45]MDO1527360.1 poly(R)-hydroxyalkanoic acid synthase subunit PhaE [Fulvimonas sp. R45]